MSAIADNNEGPIETVQVLFTLYPGYNTLDVAGPLEVLSRALHNPKDKCKHFYPPQ
jgi:putative intracellular protease/amidase